MDQQLSLTVGAWLELETDSKDIAYTRIDRTRKIPFTTLVRALDSQVMTKLLISLVIASWFVIPLKRYPQNPADSRTDEALKEIYERLRPGEPKLPTAHVACL